MNDPRQTHRSRQVGPYQLLDQIGAGAMGEIYLVRHVETEERYALKRIRGDFADEEELIRFRREAELVARVVHPNVVRLHDSNFATAHPYQVYALYSGGTLQARLQRTGALPLRDALEILRKLGAGLSHAHSQGVLHRDLKPENVLFDAAGEPALADFGLARQSVSKGNSLTATGEVLGTPVYMAPEQVLDSKRIDERADLYGLAAIGYALLSGGPPIVGAATVLQAFDKVINEAPPPLNREDVPPAVERVLLSALAKDADERPTSVADWIAQLEEASRPGEGRSLSLALGVVTLLLILSGLVLAGLQLSKPEPKRGSGPTLSATAPSVKTSPTPLVPIQTIGAVSATSLRPLVPRTQGWAWLTLSPPGEIGISLLLTCTWSGDDELSIQVTRGRYVLGSTVLDSAWEGESESHVTGLVTGVATWKFSRQGGTLMQPDLPEGVDLKSPAGLLLKRCLEPDAAAALFRLLAQSEPDAKSRLRRATWGEDTFAWEPLIWAEWLPGTGKLKFAAPPPRIRAQLKKMGVEKDAISAALLPSAWEAALTHNRCLTSAGILFPASAHFALPYGPPPFWKPPVGSTSLEPRTPVFSKPDSLVLGLSPAVETRYIAYKKKAGWLQIGWGGALGWVRGRKIGPGGPVVQVVQPVLNARRRAFFPGAKWKDSLGTNPVAARLFQGRSYPFRMTLSGPPGLNEVKISGTPRRDTGDRRWAKVQYDDRHLWVAWWQGQRPPLTDNAFILIPER